MCHKWNRRKIVKWWAYGWIQGDLVADTVEGAVEGEVKVNVLLWDSFSFLRISMDILYLFFYKFKVNSK